MILKRYGNHYHSVETNFNPTAMTEIGFQRDRAFSIAADELESGYAEVSRQELGAEADARVQGEAERRVLEELEASLGKVVAGLAEGEVLVVLNERDDHPKTRERKESVAEAGETRLHFHWWVDPPLKVAVFRPS
jgi:hypothetical protein